jgi:hypothetical protein
MDVFEHDLSGIPGLPQLGGHVSDWALLDEVDALSGEMDETGHGGPLRRLTSDDL